MPEVAIRIPQIGEGLQEARIVGFLKEPGDLVKRDEPIYQMETDKAVMDVESPFDGRIVRWATTPDSVLKIGAEVGFIDTAEVPDIALAPDTSTQKPSNPSLQEVSLKVPQIGEGLQEARIVGLLKQPGDQVQRDEPIYQMETDKAVMDVESPHSGTLVRWSVAVDDIVRIGAEVGVLATTATRPPEPRSPSTTPVPPTPVPVSGTPASAGRRRDVPPRTRAYATEKGLSAEEIENVPATGSRLMPDDVDRFLGGGTGPMRGEGYSEAPMAPKQRVLSSRLQRGAQLVVPGMMSLVCDWSEIEALRAEVKASSSEFQPSSFTMFAYCVARAAADHPIVRSTLVGDGKIRTYDHLNLGIAVTRPGDELVVAVVNASSRLGWHEFATELRDKIRLARDGTDQANESVTLSITNMQAYGIRDAVAVVVPPGAATIFLGESYWGLAQSPGSPTLQRCANVGITIDHRLINGVGGAEFLNAIRKNIESVRELIKP